MGLRPQVRISVASVSSSPKRIGRREPRSKEENERGDQGTKESKEEDGRNNAGQERRERDETKQILRRKPLVMEGQWIQQCTGGSPNKGKPGYTIFGQWTLRTLPRAGTGTPTGQGA
jgi:hypothetical protein